MNKGRISRSGHVLCSRCARSVTFSLIPARAPRPRQRPQRAAGEHRGHRLRLADQSEQAARTPARCASPWEISTGRPQLRPPALCPNWTPPAPISGPPRAGDRRRQIRNRLRICPPAEQRNDFNEWRICHHEQQADNRRSGRARKASAL